MLFIMCDLLINVAKIYIIIMILVNKMFFINLNEEEIQLKGWDGEDYCTFSCKYVKQEGSQYAACLRIHGIYCSYLEKLVNLGCDFIEHANIVTGKGSSCCAYKILKQMLENKEKYKPILEELAIK
tara:strand:- start:1848 stop:2225 length:378 start_codon:yes stop_codon:yes gene_type:complete